MTHQTTPIPTPRALEWCLHVLFVGLLVLAVGRTAIDDRAHLASTAAVAAVCATIYIFGATRLRVPHSRRPAVIWLGVLCLASLTLLVLTPDAVWLAFPLYFLQLHLLSRRSGLLAVVATTVAAITGFAVHHENFSPAVAVGPALGAAVAVAVVWGYQALYRESDRRRRLIDELTATRADLAEAQHTAGVLAERDRLAREIHDTLAQGLSSIQLLLHAAERALPAEPDTAAEYVVQARETAGDNLAEARRFVAALTPPSLTEVSLVDALQRLCATTATRHRLNARFHLDGTPVPLPTAEEVAILRITQSALSNVVRHAHATAVDVTLRYLNDRIVLDVSDDGQGFDITDVPDPGPAGGYGLPGMRARVEAFGGQFTIDSSCGQGTVLSARLPLSSSGDGAPRGH